MFDRKRFAETLIAALVAALLAGLGITTSTQVSGCGRSAPAPDCHPDRDPKPDPKPKNPPVEAIGQVRMQGGFCSGTVVGPPRPDGHWLIVSAAHCFRSVNEKVTFVTRNGRSIPAVVVALNRQSDAALLITETAVPDMPWVNVATTTPPVGSKVWHAGYGVHIPKNVERGEVTGLPNAQGQTRYWLSVSKGDSGGGIMYNDRGELLSPVCCTTRLNAPGHVWGAAPEVLQRMMAAPTEFVDDLQPVEMPPPPAEAATLPDGPPPTPKANQGGE